MYTKKILKLLDLGMRNKDQLHRILEKGLNSGIPLARIARESGVPYESLRQFKDSRSLGKEYLAKLDEWAAGNESAIVKTGHKSALGVLISETTTLLDTLNSDLDIEDKIEKFSAFVTYYSTKLDRIHKMFKKGIHGSD